MKRLALAVILVVAAVAVVTWSRERSAQTTPLATASKPQAPDKASKPASAAAAPRDTSRERPDRERTSR